MNNTKRIKLKKKRMYRELTQQDIVDYLKSKGVKITQGHYSKIENGSKNPSLKVAKEIANFFNTTIEKII